jgi:dienelactone hydrolase/membrane protease YdiL (CAAX protease family)
VAEYVPVYNRRERRFRNLGKIVFIASVVLVIFFILSLKVSVIDNDFRWDWVDLENNEGDKLSALQLTPNDIPDTGAPAVIVTHDYGGHKEQLNRISFELARHGFVVLALDLRDHGRSHGVTTYGDYNIGEPYDIIAAYNYLAEEADHVDPQRIALLGDGFGGAMCIMATNILTEQDKPVAATVAWAPPMDVTRLFDDNWDNLERYVDRRMGDAQFEYGDERSNRSTIEHMDHPNWTASNVYIIYGQRDDLIPPDQFPASLNDKAELYQVINVDHDLSENDKVLEFSMDFLYRKLNKSPRLEIEFNYNEVETFNDLVNATSVVVMIFTFLMIYEVMVMKKAARSYIPQFSRGVKPMLMGVATLIDVVIYVGVAWGMKGIYDRTTEGIFMDILPATRFYSTLFFAGLFFIGFAMLLWYLWSVWMPRDEERSEETCGNLRGIAAGCVAFLLIVINYIFGQILLFGPNYPKDYTYVLVVAICFLFFLGHELWLRKLIQPKVNSMLTKLFLRHRWPYQLTYFSIMFGLYALLGLVALNNLGGDHFGPDFGKVYTLFILVIGLVVTIIYHRSRSVMATVTYSTIIAPWLLSLAHHL